MTKIKPRPENHIKILYEFGDNDFGHTFKLVFEQLHEAWLWDSYKFENYRHSKYRHSKTDNKTSLSYSKEYICDFINMLAWPLFKARQAESLSFKEEGRFSSQKEEEDFYRNYLQATVDKIYINEEVDEFIEKNQGRANCSWFVLDTKLFNNNVYSI